jgi:hypothetical protein
MSEPKHTPGPWRWANPGEELGGYNTELSTLFGPDEIVVCNFGDSETYYPTEGEEPREADKMLIAAAPDLLDALEWAMDRIGYSKRTESNSTYCDQVDKARAAIAKAKGDPKK